MDSRGFQALDSKRGSVEHLRVTEGCGLQYPTQCSVLAGSEAQVRLQMMFWEVIKKYINSERISEVF